MSDPLPKTEREAVASRELLGHDGKQLAPSACPTCGYLMDAARCLSNKTARPKPGDFSVCLKCGEMLRFTDGLLLVVVELNDLLGMDKTTGDLMSRVQKLIRHERPVS